MARRIAQRLGVGALTLLAVSALVFLGTEALPGDAAQAVLGNTATPQLLAQYREDFGLNEPVLVRYKDWLLGALHGDLGTSLPSGDSVTSLVTDKVRNSAVLTGLTFLLLVPLSIIFGIFSAVRRDRLEDHGITTSTLLLISTPEFVVGTLLVLIVAVWLGLLPPVSLVDPSTGLLQQWRVLVLPVLTLLAMSSAHTIRMVRACMIDVLQSEYVQMARLKGVPERRVLLRHALPNAFGPTLQVLAMNVAWLLGGVVIVETVFQYPGIGLELTHAVSARDFGEVEALALLIAAVYVVVNLLADIGVMLLNPRLRKS